MCTRRPVPDFSRFEAGVQEFWKGCKARGGKAGNGLFELFFVMRQVCIKIGIKTIQIEMIRVDTTFLVNFTDFFEADNC